jgi:hypothetical protein
MAKSPLWFPLDRAVGRLVSWAAHDRREDAVRRTIPRSLLVAAVAGMLVATAGAETASASKCTRAESLVRVSKWQLSRDRAALRNASARLRRHPRSATAKRNVARAKLRVRADNQSLNRHRQSFEQNCLPGY